MEGDNIFRYRNMDIKLGGREMATVVYSNEEDDMCSLVIDGEEYVEDEERAIIPKAVLKQIRVEDIPDNFQIEICNLHIKNFLDPCSTQLLPQMHNTNLIHIVYFYTQGISILMHYYLLNFYHGLLLSHF